MTFAMSPVFVMPTLTANQADLKFAIFAVLECRHQVGRQDVYFGEFTAWHGITGAYFACLTSHHHVGHLPIFSVFDGRQKVGRGEQYLSILDGRQEIAGEITTTFNTINDARLRANGREFKLIDFNISSEIDSFSYTWSATLENINDYNELNPLDSFIEASYNVQGHDFKLLIESAERSRSNNVSYKISGRGKNALLDSRYCDKIDRAYKNISARTIIEEMCALKNISLTWQINDWVIEKYDATKVYPLDIIKKVAGAVGACVLPTVSGGLRICVRNKKRPSELKNA